MTLKDWQIILVAAILFLLCLESCKTTKNVQKSVEHSEAVTVTEEKASVNTETVTDIATKANVEMQIIEEVDTCLTVPVPVYSEDSSRVSYVPAQVRVKFKKLTNRKEFTEQSEKKKENSQADIGKKELQKTGTEAKRFKKDVERTGTPWLWPVLLIVILIAIAVLLWRLKVF